MLKCDGNTDDRSRCTGSVTHIDEKGFIYCATHGGIRSTYRRCRKLKPNEIKQLESGQPLKSYKGD